MAQNLSIYHNLSILQRKRNSETSKKTPKVPTQGDDDAASEYDVTEQLWTTAAKPPEEKLYAIYDYTKRYYYVTKSKQSGAAADPTKEKLFSVFDVEKRSYDVTIKRSVAHAARKKLAFLHVAKDNDVTIWR